MLLLLVHLVGTLLPVALQSFQTKQPSEEAYQSAELPVEQPREAQEVEKQPLQRAVEVAD